MKVIDFKTKIGKQAIHIPKKFQAELKDADEKPVRVVIFLDDSDTSIDQNLRSGTTEQFLKGYEDADSIYDNY